MTCSTTACDPASTERLSGGNRTGSPRTTSDARVVPASIPTCGRPVGGPYGWATPSPKASASLTTAPSSGFSKGPTRHTKWSTWASHPIPPKLYKDKLRHFLAQGLEYDNLVVCLDISDIQDELVYTGRHDLVDTRERRLYKTINFLRDHSLIFSFVQRFARRTSTYRRIVGHEWKYSEEKPKWTDDDPIFEEWGRLGLASAAANMDTLVDLQRSLGKRMALVVYPWPWHLREGSFENRQTAFWQDFCRRRGGALHQPLRALPAGMRAPGCRAGGP